MLKSGDKVTFKGRELETRRLPRPDDKIKRGDELDYVIVPGKEIVIEGVIGWLGKLYIPVRLQDGSIRQVLHKDLKPGRGDNVSFKEKLADIKKVDSQGKDFWVVGKTVTVKARLDFSFRKLHIPVVVSDKTIRQIPFKDLNFDFKEA